MLIRYAEYAELPLVLDMYMAALDEIKEVILSPDLLSCARVVLRSWHTAPCIIAEKDGEIIGFAGLKKTVAPYTTQAQISDYCIYVKPEHRGVKVIKLLSDACKDVSEKLGLPLFLTHIFALGKTQGSAFLDRWGYTPIATSFSYRGR